MEEPIKLTQYSHGAGCGCKISPKMLEEILQNNNPAPVYDKLIIGNESRDDAAVYDLGNGTAIISTTDFFMPIVDDPYDFGRIASANAISDVYAMGGTPLIAIAVLGWPVEKIPLVYAQKTIEGARDICKQANIPLAGGHSIDSPEPIFGLAVTGIVNKENLKANNTAREGDLIFLTKPLGVGILSTAQKRGVLKEEHLPGLISQLVALNSIGEKLGSLKQVTAMTDVTGFGLLGHLIEICEGSNLSAELNYSAIQVAPGVREYIAQRIFPDATTRNWSSYGTKVKFSKEAADGKQPVNVMEAFTLLPDPQTNGGILFTARPSALTEVKNILKEKGLDNFVEPIGQMIHPSPQIVLVK